MWIQMFESLAILAFIYMVAVIAIQYFGGGRIGFALATVAATAMLIVCPYYNRSVVQPIQDYVSSKNLVTDPNSVKRVPGTRFFNIKADASFGKWLVLIDGKDEKEIGQKKTRWKAPEEAKDLKFYYGGSGVYSSPRISFELAPPS